MGLLIPGSWVRAPRWAHVAFFGFLLCFNIPSSLYSILTHEGCVFKPILDTVNINQISGKKTSLQISSQIALAYLKAHVPIPFSYPSPSSSFTEGTETANVYS